MSNPPFQTHYYTLDIPSRKIDTVDCVLYIFSLKTKDMKNEIFKHSREPW